MKNLIDAEIKKKGDGTPMLKKIHSREHSLMHNISLLKKTKFSGKISITGLNSVDLHSSNHLKVGEQSLKAKRAAFVKRKKSSKDNIKIRLDQPESDMKKTLTMNQNTL